MKRSTALAPLALAALLLAGCSGDPSPSTSAASEPAAASDSAGASDSAAASTADSSQLPGSPGGEAAGSTAPAGPAPLGRVGPAAAVIRTGELEVVVDDVRRAAEEAGGVARSAGGSVESEERTSDDGSGSAVLRLRVPPAAFDDTLRALSALGKEQSRRLRSQDVTDSVVDLDSRLATQRASVERVRTLLAEADTLGEVVQVESELTRRTADLESLQARLATLNEQVDLSSVTLRLTAKRGVVAGSGPPGFRDGVQKGWEALLTVGRITAVVAGVLLPFTPLLVALLLLLWRVRTRRTA